MVMLQIVVQEGKRRASGVKECFMRQMPVVKAFLMATQFSWQHVIILSCLRHALWQMRMLSWTIKAPDQIATDTIQNSLKIPAKIHGITCVVPILLHNINSQRDAPPSLVFAEPHCFFS